MTQEMLNLAQPCVTLKEKLNTRFDNPTSSIDICLEHPVEKDPRRWREDTDKGTYNQYDRYTPLKTSSRRIYQECVNTVFRKA